MQWMKWKEDRLRRITQQTAFKAQSFSQTIIFKSLLTFFGSWFLGYQQVDDK